MRRIRAIAVMMALVLALLGTQATTANAAVTGGHAKGSSTSVNDAYGELAFHASGYLLNGTGGFERYTEAPGGYFSGKVVCYVQEGTTRGTFVARITKADDPTLINKYVIVWLAPARFSFSIVQTYTCSNSLITPGVAPEPIEAGGYITLRP